MTKNPMVLLIAALFFTPSILAFPFQISDTDSSWLDSNFFDKRADSNTDLSLTNPCAKTLPSTFEEAANFRARAQPWCDKLKPSLAQGSEGKVDDTLDDSSHLEDATYLEAGDPLGITITMSLTEDGKKELGDDDAKLNDFCLGSLELFGTKGKGCTKERAFYKANGGSATKTGVKEGDLEIWKGETKFGFVKMGYA